jgi:hypothetical protein
MDEMESKLNAVLSNPDMMAQIMSMAQALGGGAPSPPPPQPVMPDIPEGLDIGMITKLAGMANSANVDKDQRALLIALRPYLTNDRIGKLERAMRATKLAGLATTLLGSGILTRAGR